MNYLGIDEHKLKETGAIHTAREIQQQPDVWNKIYMQIKRDANEIRQFVKIALENADEIILTGAGTSAFIGNCLVHEYNKIFGGCTRAIPTTDIVTHPGNFFNKNKKVLLISFARSGNSPESCAAVNMAEQYAGKAYHLIVTCNPEGHLVNNIKPLQYSIVLPPETNDISLAMTSSFSGMLLTGLLIARIGNIDSEQSNVEAIAGYSGKIIRDYVSEIQGISGHDFTRAVFLGSGPLFGTAIESHLKLQELTAGRVICKSDSYLGFRHGPKAVIDNNTIVVFLMSNDAYVHQYEADLIKTIKKEGVAKSLIGISERKILDLRLDLEISMSDKSIVDEVYLSIPQVIPAQILGFFKSLNLGLNPDNPSDSGTITRVVQGVVIYDNY